MKVKSFYLYTRQCKKQHSQSELESDRELESEREGERETEADVATAEMGHDMSVTEK